MSVKRGLGKGLESLLSSTITTAKKEAASMEASIDLGGKSFFVSGKSIVSVKVSDIVPNPNQPRQTFNQASLNELAQSIKDHGIAQPVLLRKKADKYELIAGERRVRAAKIAGLINVPAIIKDMSDEESLEIAIIENIQREDLNIIEEAESYQLLMKKFSLTQDQVSQKVGKARSSVANTLRLLDLPSQIKESLRKNEISAGHARAILSGSDSEKQLEIWKQIRKGELNVRDSEKLASGKKSQNEKIKNASLSSIEQEISSKLATRVNLSGSEQKGKIEISYFSKDDLERIYSLLIK